MKKVFMLAIALILVSLAQSARADIWVCPKDETPSASLSTMNIQRVDWLDATIVDITIVNKDGDGICMSKVALTTSRNQNEKPTVVNEIWGSAPKLSDQNGHVTFFVTSAFGGTTVIAYTGDIKIDREIPFFTAQR